MKHTDILCMYLYSSVRKKCLSLTLAGNRACNMRRKTQKVINDVTQRAQENKRHDIIIN